MKKILLTGKDGQVGWELQRTLAPLGRVYAFDRRGLDLADPSQIREVVRRIAPDILVNAGAYTAVDLAETEEALANRINGQALRVLATECKRLNAMLVHFSTDYVFDGRKSEPYTEQDVPNPLGAYGRSKLLGEQEILDIGAQAIILRTGWIYAQRGKNFLLTIRRLALERPELRVVNDQIGAPTWARLLAEACAHILAQLSVRSSPISSPEMYHLTCSGQTTWHGFAAAILDQIRHESPTVDLARLLPTTASEYGARAMRPSYSLLCNDKVERQFGLRLPRWIDALALCHG